MKLFNDKHEIDDQFDYFNSMTVCSLSRIYLFAAALIHAMLCSLYFLSDQKILATINVSITVLYIAFGAIVNMSTMRKIYCIVIIEIVVFIIISVYAIGWHYCIHMYSFSIIALAILTSIAKTKDRYELGYPVVIFLVSHGILFVFRIYTWFNPIVPSIKLTQYTELLFEIQSIINYVFVALATFLPLLAFLVDLNKTNENMEMKSAELEYISTHDLLTSLLNRRSMKDKFDKLIESYKDKGQEFSMILGDIDNFKKINDEYGHSAGDYVLASVSRSILDTVEDGYVCRWGGEEILIVVYMGKEETYELAENIRKNIEDSQYIYDNKKIEVTLTQGVAQYQENTSIEGLIAKVDENLYKGKQSSKNCVVA